MTVLQIWQNTDEDLLFKYGKQMLWSEEEWVCEKIQEILNKD
jgi:hypothetical protein